MPNYEIQGADLQSVICSLSAGEMVYAEIGHVLAVSDGLQMSPTTKGGLWNGLKRAVAGSTFFLNGIEARQPGQVLFSAHSPGKIQELEVAAAASWICQQGSFLCGDREVLVEPVVTKKVGAGLFGGNGFILQRLTGAGKAFIHLNGAGHKFSLAEGQTLRVEVGCLAAFSESVTYDIEIVGGLKSMLFSGEGIWFAHLTGPGDVYVQSLTLAKLAKSLQPYLLESRTNTAANLTAGGILGGLTGAMISKDDGDSEPDLVENQF